MKLVWTGKQFLTVGFLTVGFALFSGDLLPGTVQVPMLVGGVAALTSPFVPRF